MKLLLEAESPRATRTADRAGDRQHVGVTLFPRRVGDLGDDGFDACVVRVEHVVEADRVEAVAEKTQMGEQADRARGPHSGALLHESAYRLVERQLRRPQKILAAKPGE